jgi:hypothetical protein
MRCVFLGDAHLEGLALILVVSEEIGESTISRGDRHRFSAREGSRPRTSRSLPHIQLDQWPPEELILKLTNLSLQLEGVNAQESRMASVATKALYLPIGLARGPAEAFVDENEFCYLHPPPAGSIHLTLPNPQRQMAIDLNWAELHPGVTAGVVPPTLVMVYAPRNEHELAIVLELVNTSYGFAKVSEES